MLIVGGELVTPEGRRRAALRISRGVITEIGELALRSGEEKIDASNLMVLPGIIDCHTHFALDTGKMQTLDDFESGSLSAAAGGVTTYINFAPQQRQEGLKEAFNRERTRASGHSTVDYALHLSFGSPGPGWQEELVELVELGVTSMKVYTTYKDTIYYTRDWDWYQLMRLSGRAGITVQVHAENDDIVAGKTADLLAQRETSFRHHASSRPVIAEIEAVSRGLAFCRDTGSPIYFVHLSSPDSVELVARARQDGLPAYAEVCPHHLTLEDSVYHSDLAPRFVMTPPLRDRGLVEGLRQLVSAGAVDAVGSDHCGYGLGQRGDGMDFTQASPGIPGVETLWPVTYSALVASGLCSLEEGLRLVTQGPASIFGLAPRKGSLRVGADADLDD